MKSYQLFKLYHLLLLFIPTFIFGKNVTAPQDTVYKNTFSIDFAASYYTFFDNRIQYRIATEYQHKLSTKKFVGIQLDAGMYDHYTYIKYYDFFNAVQPMYSISQKSYVVGFRLIPSLNYFIKKGNSVKRPAFFIGLAADYGYYYKNTLIYNSNTLAESKYAYQQINLGLGACLGFKYKIAKRIVLEAKTSLFTNLFYISTAAKQQYIPALHAQWNASNSKFWWLSSLKLGYEF